MKRLKQLFENLVYLSKVDIKQRERIIDEVRDWVKKPAIIKDSAPTQKAETGLLQKNAS